MTRPLDPACVALRESIHVRLDGEPLDVDAAAELDAHLARCAACRALAAELHAIHERLRALPELGLPDAVLQEVWRRTTSARSGGRVRWLAAAAGIVGLLFGGLWLYRNREATPSPQELARASREARMVLRLAGRALERTENVAIHAVLTEEVSGTLRRVPIDWPEPRAVKERSGS